MKVVHSDSRREILTPSDEPPLEHGGEKAPQFRKQALPALRLGRHDGAVADVDGNVARLYAVDTASFVAESIRASRWRTS
ncbi:hypothetical protein GWI33_014159 [Rhynchophorus ferrugineus]|uniref:Uncharacterized protein n=1 Tax=Rhynchophorus ferrugineus TaxID=354439 RepID=A0A834I5L8_RHYFE|nr:hypothetical protein GWI33_014159 [Rhynchophorus ferrugineus]